MNLTGKEILLIDDNEDFLFIMRSILQNVGITVSEAKSASEGFQAFQKRFPHMIICDLGMKPHSGFDFLRLLSSKTGKPPVPVLVMSGNDSKEAVTQAMSLGAADYLVKPVETTILLQKIRKNLKNNEFGTYTFPDSEKKIVSVEIPATITGASEAGFQVAAPIRLAPKTKVKMKSALLSTLELEGYPLISGPGLGYSLERGTHNNEIRLAGVSEEIAFRIRKFIRLWK